MFTSKNDIFKKTVALVALFSFLPPIVQAYEIDLETKVNIEDGDPTINYVDNKDLNTDDNGWSNITITTPSLEYVDNKDLNTDDNDYLNNSLDDLAPDWTDVKSSGQCTNAGCGKIITITTPSLELEGEKKEGRWRFDVNRNNFNDFGEILYDATAPACPPNPDINEYVNNTDYFTVNNLQNPWPDGLNGNWANKSDVISFSKNDPTLCRDRIHLDGVLKYERKFNLNNCENTYYKEDATDCKRLNQSPPLPARETESSFYMSGCRGANESVQLSSHRQKANFILFDQAGNRANCTSPEARVDLLEPVISNFEIEHEGLDLPKENLNTSPDNKNNFRADDGPLLLHVNLKDADTTADSGRSGLNFEPITSNSAITNLETEIRNAESQLGILLSNVNSYEADIILKRAEILQRLALKREQIATNNLYYTTSEEINKPDNTFMQSFGPIEAGATTIDANDINESQLTDISNIINRSKFDNVTDIDIYRQQINNLNGRMVNRQKSEYLNGLNPLLARKVVNPYGDLLSLTTTNNEFDEFFNQWQIDKTKNYSSIVSNWIQELNKIDSEVNKINTKFNDINNALSSEELSVLLEMHHELSDSFLQEAINTVIESSISHKSNQDSAVAAISKTNKTIDETRDFLINFEPNTDTFDPQKISVLTTHLAEATDEVLGIRADLRDGETSGTFANGLYIISAIEDGQEFKQLIDLANENIRNLQSGIVSSKQPLEALEQLLDTEKDAITTLESYILNKRTELTNLIEERNELLNPSIVESTDEIIEKISSSNYVNRNFGQEYIATTAGHVIIRNDAQGSANCTYFGKVNGQEITRAKAKDWIDGHISFAVPAGSTYEVSRQDLSGCADSWMKFAPITTNLSNAFGQYRDINFDQNYSPDTAGYVVVRNDAQGSANCTYTGYIDGQEITRAKAKDWIDAHMSFAVPDGSTFRVQKGVQDMTQCADSWLKFMPIKTGENTTINKYEDKAFDLFHESNQGGYVVIRDDAQGSANCTYIGYINGQEVIRAKAKDWIDGHMSFFIPELSNYRITRGLDAMNTCGDSWMKYAELVKNETKTKFETNTPSLTEQKITNIGIERLNGEKKYQEFFPPSTEPTSGNNYEWDINSFRFEGESAPIFTKAGKYKVTVRAFDVATNQTVKHGYINIRPAKLEVEVSSNCNNASDLAYADNSETCNISLPQRDRFGNKVDPNFEMKVAARDQDIDGSYNLLSSLGANFVNGIRFNGGNQEGNQHVYTWNPNGQNQANINMRSLLPTIDVVEYGADPDYAIGFEISNGVDTAFIFEYPNIGKRGSKVEPPNNETIEIPVRFKPWVNVRAKGSAGAFDNRGWNPEIAKPFDLYVDADTGGGLDLPANFVVNLTGFVGDSYEFNDEDLSKPGQNITFAGISSNYAESTGSAGLPDPLSTTINSISALSSMQSSRALFIPTVAYIEGGKDIVLPGLPAGTCPDNDPEACFVTEPEPNTTVDVNISNASTTEGGTLNFNVNLSESIPERDLTIYLGFDHVSTSAGDFQFPTQNFVTIPAGASSEAFPISTTDDAEVEEDETMTLKVISVDKPELVRNTSIGTGVIYDNDNELNLNDISAVEGSRCLFSFSIDRPESEDVVITTRAGEPGDTATGGTGNDYDNSGSTVTIPAGETRVIAPVQTYEDTVAEGDEFFTLVVDSVVGGDLSSLTASTTCSIEDNDIEPNIYLQNANVVEGSNVPVTVIVGEGDPSGRADNEDIELRLRTYEITDSNVAFATRGVDYVHKTFDVTIPAFQKSVTIPASSGIVTNSDTLNEGDEYFGIEVIGVTNDAKIGARNNRATITIEDEYTPPTKPSVASIVGQTGYEASPEDTVRFTVNLDTENETGAPINLTLNLNDGTATAGDDFDGDSVTVSIPNGAINGVSDEITIYNDDVVEAQEYFTANVIPSSVSPTGALLSTTGTGTAYIEDDDKPKVDLTIEDAQSCESRNCDNTNNALMNFKVRLSGPYLNETEPLVVSFEPSEITPSLPAYFAPGEYKATFDYLETEANLEAVEIYNNSDVDGSKQFEMSFKEFESGDTNLIGDTSDTAIGTILDDDRPTPSTLPNINRIEGQTATEGSAAGIQFTVHLDAPNNSGSTINMALELSDGSAEAGVDFNGTPVSVSIPNGASSGVSSAVNIIDDSEEEPQENFYADVVVSSVNPRTALGSVDARGVGFITDNDGTIGSKPRIDRIEGETGDEYTPQESVEFRVYLDQANNSGSDLSMELELLDDSATAGSDYDGSNVSVTIPNGATFGISDPVAIIDDAEVESHEMFVAEIIPSSISRRNAIRGPVNMSGYAFIRDNDTDQPPKLPEIVITDGSAVEGQQVEFKVGLTSPAVDTTTVELATQNITTQNIDYTCSAEDLEVIFATGEMNPQLVQCDILLDNENEDEEVFEVLVADTTGPIRMGGDNDKGTVSIINFQTLDLVMEEPPIFMEDVAGGLAEFVVRLKDNGADLTADQMLESPLSFSIAPEDITAIGSTNFAITGTDYRSGEIEVEFEPGKGLNSTSAVIGVAINNDTVVEINSEVTSFPENRHEHFSVNLESTDANIRSIESNQATIQDEDAHSCDDKPIVKVIDDALKVEGTELYFDVLLDRSLCGNETVNLEFKTTNSSALAGSDYVDETFNVTITAGNRRPNESNRIYVQTIDDTIDEQNENLFLEFVGVSPSDSIQRVERYSIRSDLSQQSQGIVNVGGIAAIGTIVDNDTDTPGDPTLTISNTSATEGEDLLYEVRLSETNKGSDIEVELVATPGTNASNADFSSGQVESGFVLATMVIKNGEQLGTLKGTTIRNAVINTTENSVVEADKEINLNFRNLDSGDMNTVGIATGIGTILDDDTSIDKPYVTLSDGSAIEGEPITFTLSLENTGSGPTIAPTGGIDFTIRPRTLSGPDTAQSDEFESSDKVVRMPQNTSSTTFTIDTLNDELEENAETFQVQIRDSNVGSFLENASTLTSVTGTGTINDNYPADECAAYGINCPEEEIILPGAAIEGQIIADELVCEGDACDNTEDDSVVLGSSNVATDVREEITRNAYELIRGRTAANANGASIPLNDSSQPIIKENSFTYSNGNFYPRWDIYLDDLPDGGVTYLNGDINGDGNLTGDENRSYFRLGLRRSDDQPGTLSNPAVMSGRHTIIVENASLNIIGDLEYASADDSLGIIVLNDSIEDLDNLNRRGQLAIFKNVKHVIGALFTDGSLVSNVWIDAGAGDGRVNDAIDSDPSNDWDTVNSSSRLGRQLILSGNILSKNTIGKADKTPPEGPWGDLNQFPVNERQPRAQMYDFNYIRRYVPVYTSPGVLDADSRDRCSIIPGETECYDNFKSFVIRVDPRLRENPPPGFQAEGIQSLR